MRLFSQSANETLNIGRDIQQSLDVESFERGALYQFIEIVSQIMNKLLQKSHSPLKFDTSSANLNCFIDSKSKQKHEHQDLHPRRCRNRRREGVEYQKQGEFQDRAFLQSIVSKILTDADCQGISELIDNMVFPNANGGEKEADKDSCMQQLEQQEINQIFSNFNPFNNLNSPRKFNGYDQNNDYYRVWPSHLQFTRQLRLENSTTPHSSAGNAYLPCVEDSDSGVATLQHFNSVNSFGYPYAFYQQTGYQQQTFQRKRKNFSGEEIQQFRIVPKQIQADGRTTLMIRHIPNKYTEEMLLDQIGKYHRLHINFLYLPIDHYNSCNVGYAFVNFTHPKFIIQFYKAFNRRSWERFNSEKICQLAYARIQGTINLMDHFQSGSNVQNRGRVIEKSEIPNKQSEQAAMKDVMSASSSQKDGDN